MKIWQNLLINGGVLLLLLLSMYKPLNRIWFTAYKVAPKTAKILDNLSSMIAIGLIAYFITLGILGLILAILWLFGFNK